MNLWMIERIYAGVVVKYEGEMSAKSAKCGVLWCVCLMKIWLARIKDVTLHAE